MHMDIFIWTFLRCWQISKLGRVCFYRQASLISTAKHTKGIKIKISIAVVGSSSEGRLFPETHTRREQLPKFFILGVPPGSLSIKSCPSGVNWSILMSLSGTPGKFSGHSLTLILSSEECLVNSFLVSFPSRPLPLTTWCECAESVSEMTVFTRLWWSKFKDAWNSSFSQALDTSAIVPKTLYNLLWLYNV